MIDNFAQGEFVRRKLLGDALVDRPNAACTKLDKQITTIELLNERQIFLGRILDDVSQFPPEP